MNTLESRNDLHTEQLSAKVSRLKNVSLYFMEIYLKIKHYFCFIFKIAIDIDNETKEHNRFLETMVSQNKLNNSNQNFNIIIAF